MRHLAPFLLLATLLHPTVGRSASADDIRSVGEELVCYCGCSGLTVAACSCGTADAIRERIASQLDSGLSPEEVVQTWVAERGEQILAVPTRVGFNLVGWIMPFAATFFALAIVTTVLLRRKQALAPGDIPPSHDEREYLDRIDTEMRSRRG